MRKYLFCVFLLVAILAYTKAESRETIERSLCFFHNLCGRSRSVTAFCRLMGNWNNLDGERMKEVCGDAEDYDKDDEDDDDD